MKSQIPPFFTILGPDFVARKVPLYRRFWEHACGPSDPGVGGGAGPVINTVGVPHAPSVVPSLRACHKHCRLGTRLGSSGSNPVINAHSPPVANSADLDILCQYWWPWKLYPVQRHVPTTFYNGSSPLPRVSNAIAMSRIRMSVCIHCIN